MTATEHIALTSLVDEIAFRLETAILEGDFRPGTHLLQDELCARYGVSRTPVREALRKLQAQHLVVLVPNKGATVRFPSKAELRDVYVVRAELEGFACELACATLDGEQAEATLAALDAAQADIQAAHVRRVRGQVSPDEEPSFNAQITSANEAFHSVLFNASGNAQLAQLCHSLQGYFPKDYVWRAALPPDEAHVLNIEEHHAIRDAVEARDGAGARRAMSAHVAHGGEVLLTHLERHGFWSD